MKKTLVFAMLLAACGDDDGTGGVDAPGTADAPPTIDAPPPPQMPAVAATQIDRMGRPAINTALTKPFDPEGADKTAAKDAYNQNADQTTWGATYLGGFTDILAIIDALNLDADAPGTLFDGCGDQPGYVPIAGGGVDNNTAYAMVSGLASDDRLYVNTTYAECFFYLGVEAGVLNILPSDEDCGGRVPSVSIFTQDAIDISYQVLAGDPTNEPSDSISDGVSMDDKQTGHGNATFPFLAAP